MPRPTRRSPRPCRCRRAPTCRRRASRTSPLPTPRQPKPPTEPDAPASRRGQPEPQRQAAAGKPAAGAGRDHQSRSPATDGAKFTTASAADTAVVDKLRDQLAAGKFDRILGGKKERATVEAFYASRDFAPLWIADGAMSERAKAAAAYLAGVDADGLEPSEYPVPQIKAGMEPEALAEAEIKFTDAVLTFARHAMSGRVHYSRVSADIIYDLAKPDPANVLARVAKAQDAGAALDSLNPPQPQYKALKAKLAEIRNGAHDVAKPVIAAGSGAEVQQGQEGQRDRDGGPARAGAARAVQPEGADGNTNYDKALSRRDRQVPEGAAASAPTGSSTPATLDAINGPKREKTVDIIIANMERWRWMPRDLGNTYVMVNIPDFTLRVVQRRQARLEDQDRGRQAEPSRRRCSARR